MQQGGGVGDTRALLGAGQVASSAGAFGRNTSNTNQGIGAASNLLGIYSGLKQGGVAGDTSAGVSAAQLGARAGLFGNASSTVGTVAGYAAVPLAVYNAVENYRSGAGTNDAINGAEAGAAIGSVVPGIGTLIGGAIGGIVGGVSSAFGPGQEDPENVGWNNYASAYNKSPAAVQGATPSQNFQSLAGIFDSRGTSIPFYNQFGRMGENQFMQSMGSTINQAVSSGKIPSNASASQIYNSIVQPWITSMGGSSGWKDTNTVKGAPEKAAVGNLLTNIIQQWQQGAQFNGIQGQQVSMPTYGG